MKLLLLALALLALFCLAQSLPGPSDAEVRGPAKPVQW